MSLHSGMQSLIRAIVAVIAFQMVISVALAQISGSSCLGANGGTVCTAGDLQVSGVTVTEIIDGCVNLSDTAVVNLTATLLSGSSQRYDVGIWINEDGTSALTGGQCFRDWLPVADGYAEEEGTRADSCGTVLNNTSVTRDMFSVTLPCADLDGDTFGEVSTCLSWKNTSKNDCPDISGAVPGTGSKCQCGIADIDGLPIPNLSITKSCTPDEVSPGGLISCTITISNAIGAGTAVNVHFEDDYPQSYGSVSTLMTTQGSASDDGDIIDIQTGDIPAGATIDVTYDFLVNSTADLPEGSSADTFTNIVETFYTNTNGVVTNQNLSATDDTTVPVSISFVMAELRANDEQAVIWQTQTEAGNLGFNILVADRNGEALQQLNPELIPSKSINSVITQDYEFPTSFDLSQSEFYIQDVDVYGNLTNNGPYQFYGKHGKKVAKRPLVQWAEIRQDSSTLHDGRVSKNKRKNSKNKHDNSLPVTMLIEVKDLGVQRVYFDALRAAGLTELDNKTKHLSLSDHGVTVPFWLGESVNGQYIEFLGESSNTLYADSNFYELTLGKGSYIKKTKSSTGPSEQRAAYRKVIQKGSDKNYSSLLEGIDPWYDAKVFAINGPTTKAYSFETPDLVASGENATAVVTANLAGSIDFPEANDHHVEILLNDRVIADSVFDGLTRETIKVGVPHSYLVQSGANIISIRVTGDTPRQIDLILIDSVSLEYNADIVGITQARVAADNNSITSVEELHVYLESNNGEVLKLEAEQTRNGNFSYRVKSNNYDGQTLHIAKTSNLYFPDVFVLEAEKKASSSANHLVITHPDFMGDDLNNYLSSRSEKVRGDFDVIDVFDIYYQYSDHQRSPEAIREFIRQSSAFGQLKSIMIVGADSFDYKNNLELGSLSFVPTFYARTSPVVSQSPTDALLADINGDYLADYPIGRLPVRNIGELQSLMSKMTTLRNRSDENSALLISDKDDDVNEITFSQDNEQFAGVLSSRGWSTNTIDLGGENGLNSADAKQAILDSINGSTTPKLVVYNGHSSMTTWSSSGLFSYDDAIALTNDDKPFISLQWGCWNSYYVAPGRRTLADALLNLQSGAAAVLGMSTLSQVKDQTRFSKILHDVMTMPNYNLGEALTIAKQQFSRRYPNRLNVILGMNLLGDPTLEF